MHYKFATIKLWLALRGEIGVSSTHVWFHGKMHHSVDLTFPHFCTFSLVLNKANAKAASNLEALKERSKTAAAMAPSEKVSITKKALEDLKKRAAESEKSKREVKTAQKAQATAEQKVADLDKELKDLKAEYDDLKDEYDDLAADVKQKALTIEAYEKSPASSVVVSTKAKAPKKEDLNQELVNHVTQTAKTVMFRTWKFIEDEEEEDDITKEIIPYLPVDIGMEEAEFVANYKNVVYDAIKNARTDVQSNGKKRAQGT